MLSNESVGKKIVEALKKQAESIDVPSDTTADTSVAEISAADDFLTPAEDVFAEHAADSEDTSDFFADEPKRTDPFCVEDKPCPESAAKETEQFEMPANILVLRKLISQLPSGVSRHTGAQIIKQTMEALGISMKSVLQDAQQAQDNMKSSAKECQAAIQEYKKQILTLEKKSQSYQKQYSALNDLISLFIQTAK